MKQYLVIYEEGPTGWSAYVPDLPCVVAAADTRAEVEQLIREAIPFHIAGLRRHGEPVPEPTLSADMVAVAAA